MRFPARWPSKTAMFSILMAVSALLAVMPAGWSRWMRGPFQVLGLPQWLSHAAVYGGRRVVHGASRGEVSREEYARLEEENARLKQLLAQQHQWLVDLERRYDDICGLKGQLAADRFEVLVAPVLGFDVSARRDTLLIGRGAGSGVEEGQWVAAGLAAGEWGAARSGAELLFQQWLIGRVAQVEGHTSRVLLTSDPKWRGPVYLVKVLPDGTWQPSEQAFLLRGLGRGRMVVEQADADYAALGYGLVAVPPARDLPALLSVGRITGSEPLPESALHFNLQVVPWGDVTRLRYVYVLVRRP